jgi:3-carboxy-cis,cis-muconate cycloisomerase
MAEAIAFALSGKISRQEAQQVIEDAVRKAVAEKRSLQNVLGDDARVTAHLSGPTLARLFEPMSYQGAAQTFVDRLIGSLKIGGGKRP